MNKQEYGKMRDLEETYWWHVGRRAIINVILKKYLGVPAEDKNPPLLLDLGCGTGGNASLLKEFGMVIGADNSPEALKFAQNEGFSKLVAIEGAKLPFPSEMFDCVALLDVLEHIEDDNAMLFECRRVLKPGGSLILTVPAYQWLFSGHDEVLNHKRRYLMRNLTGQLSNAGFRVCLKSYAIVFLFPLMAFYRVTERMIKRKQKTSYVIFPTPINNFFIFLLKIEALMLKFGLSFSFGTSVIVYAKKQLKDKKKPL